jgi:hypothetical protein
MPQLNEMTRARGGIPSDWPTLVSRAVNDISRILQAEIRLVELGIKNVVEQEIDRALKAALALTMLMLGAVCGVAAAIVGLHALLGMWWAAFAIVAGASIAAGGALLMLSLRRPSSSKPIRQAESAIDS